MNDTRDVSQNAEQNLDDISTCCHHRKERLTLMRRSDPQPRSRKTPTKGTKTAKLEKILEQSKRLECRRDIHNLWGIGPSKRHFR